MPQYMDDDDDIEKEKVNEACLKGGVADIKRAVSGKLNEYVKDGMTAMHLVAMSGREDMEEIIDNLIKDGSNVDSTTQFERDTILHLLIRHAPLRIAFPTCLTLLRHNPDLDIRNRNLRTAYDLAIAKGYFDLANILDGSKTPPQAEKYYTTTVVTMHGSDSETEEPDIATERRETDTEEIEIDSEIYFDVENQEYDYYEVEINPLETKKLVEAILRDDEDGAREAINNGADCNFINEHGAGAIHYMFTDHYRHPPLNILPMMVNANADVNLRDYEGDTALNLLIKCSRLRAGGDMYKIVVKMLDWGADPTLKDLDGNDSIALASKYDYKDIAKILRKQKTTNLTAARKPPPSYQPTSDDIPKPGLDEPKRERKPKPRKPRTPEPEPDEESPIQNENEPENVEVEEEEESISAAIEGGDDPLLEEILADPDADLNKANSRGLFPIHLAIMREDLDERNRFVKRLMRKGADVNSRVQPSGNTALHMAVARNQMSTVKLLLTYNPTYSVPNDEGNIPYNLAEINGNVQMMRLLENYKRETIQKKVKEANSSTCTIL